VGDCLACTPDIHPPECVIPDDVLIQFGPPDDEHLCSKHVEAGNKYMKKECVKLVTNQNYVKMHGQQNMRNISCESELLLNQNRATCNYLNISLTQTHVKSRHIAVGVVAKLRDSHRTNHGWIPERSKRFSVPAQRTDQPWCRDNLLYNWNS
jgi:hypothetical protein